MDNLKQQLGIEEPELETILGIENPIKELLGIGKPIKIHESFYTPMEEPKKDTKKLSVIDRIKGLKDKLLKKIQ